MIIVTVKEGENIDRALKKFKRKFEKTGAVRELRARKNFEKLSTADTHHPGLAKSASALCGAEPDGFANQSPEVAVEMVALGRNLVVVHLRKTAGDVRQHHIAAISQQRAGNAPYSPPAGPVEAQGQDGNRPKQHSHKGGSECMFTFH